MSVRRRWLATVLSSFLVAGCQGGSDATQPFKPGNSTPPGPFQSAPQSAAGAALGGEAVWRIDPQNPPSSTATSFSVLVERLGCNSGETGQVLKPDVVEDPEKVVVTFAVVPVPDAAGCPGNRAVPSEVLLSAPVGSRTLVDGACLSGAASTTSYCQVSTRWPQSRD